MKGSAINHERGDSKFGVNAQALADFQFDGDLRTGANGDDARVVGARFDVVRDDNSAGRFVGDGLDQQAVAEDARKLRY